MKNLRRFLPGRSLPFAAISILLAAAVAQADIETYEADLSGAQEVPPVVTDATGTMELVVDTVSLEATWVLQFVDLSSAQTGAHIHFAPAGANGGVVLGLPLGSPVNGIWSMTQPQYDDLAASNYYVNVHTTTFPGGEIRGQLFRSGTVGNESTMLGAVKALYR